MITDNALIAFECLHAINSNADERSKFCAYKLDLSKAYDRVEWCFLRKVLLELGFQSTWVDRVMTCVTSVRYTVRFNGVMSAPFTPTRGLQQELQVCRNAPGVSHLLFADDTLFFSKPQLIRQR